MSIEVNHTVLSPNKSTLRASFQTPIQKLTLEQVCTVVDGFDAKRSGDYVIDRMSGDRARS